MSLQAHLDVRWPGFHLDVVLRADPGSVIALLGPNGAGKSTTLRALAGLQDIAYGEIQLNGDDIQPLLPNRRPIGVVFQDYLLFPHLSAMENVAFGLRARGVSKVDARATAREWLDRVGLADLAERRPRQLSGGQAQRVALARALAVEPALLLLDEPLAALDVSTRPGIRAELGRHLASYPGICVLVTHDPIDAMTLADRIIVLENGAITQQGTPEEIARAPRSDYAARLVGLNFYRGHASDSVIELHEGGELAIAQPHQGEVCVAFPPAAVALFPDRPTGSPRNCWPVTVSAIEGLHGSGAVVRVKLTGKPAVLADVTAAAVSELGLTSGTELWAVVKATEIRVYPA